MIDSVADFSQNFFRTSTARFEKFNHDFNHENIGIVERASYTEKAVFVPMPISIMISITIFCTVEHPFNRQINHATSSITIGRGDRVGDDSLALP